MVDSFEDRMIEFMMKSILAAGFAVVLLPRLFEAVSPLVTQAIQAPTYQGRTDSREHTATDVLSWIDFIHDYPYTPWISAYFINDGPDAVEIAINYPNDRFTLNPMETVTVNRPGAQERIAIIFLKCAEGETANVRITGEY